MSLGKGVLKICNKVTGERPCRKAISIKLHFYMDVLLVNLQHICRIYFLKNTSGWPFFKIYIMNPFRNKTTINKRKRVTGLRGLRVYCKYKWKCNLIPSELHFHLKLCNFRLISIPRNYITEILD